jgi:hypothetical protein
LIYCDEEGWGLRTFQSENPGLRSGEVADGLQDECLACADALQMRDSKECGLDRTLSETFPCSDPLSSIPNPVAHPSIE